MPELPDLEVLKERFQTLVGDSIVSVDVRFPLTFRVTVEGSPAILSGQKVHHIQRRGKFLIFKLDQLYLVFNLMLTGRLQLTDQSRLKPNTVAIITFTSGKEVRFIDFKKMGKIYVTDTLEKVPQYPELGVEPLSDQFTFENFKTLLNDSREIKLVLTDQKIIAGIGNAYSDEILFHARLNPQRKADSLTDAEGSQLYNSVYTILNNAISEVGNRLKDTSEKVRDFYCVHGKKGQPCPVCGSVIREIEVFGRVTHVCPQCQKVKFPV